MPTLPNINSMPVKAVSPTAAVQPAQPIKQENSAPNANDDFAAVLKKQMAEPSQVAEGESSTSSSSTPATPKNTAASQAATDDTASVGEELESDEMENIAAPDLSTLLPALAALLHAGTPNTATGLSGEGQTKLADPLQAVNQGAAQAGLGNDLSAITTASTDSSDQNLTDKEKAQKTIDPALFAANEKTKAGFASLSSDSVSSLDAPNQVDKSFVSLLGNAANSKTLSSDLKQELLTPLNNVEAAMQNTRAGEQLQAATTLAQTNARNDTPAIAYVSTPVGVKGWDAELGQKIVWLTNRQESRAELILTPPNMGKIEVTITMNGDQANALFVSASQSARDALENALPRLREILAEAGITLGQANVNAESAQQGKNESRENTRGESARSALTDNVQNSPSQTQWVKRSNSLVDTFA